MLGKILKKEIMLSMHPTVPMMLLLCTMVFIPNYPYTVIFFYTTLSIFFTCLLGRENNDITYSLNLPIAKDDIVKGRMLFVVICELLQVLFTLGLSILKSNLLPDMVNEAGMDANIALIGIGLIIFGVFNIVFFGGYYKNVNNVGKSFLKGSIAVSIIAAIVEASAHAVPFVKDKLDTIDPSYMSEKLIVLGVGIVVYIVLTLITYKKSLISFNKQDL